MQHKYLKMKTLLLTHARIKSPETFLGRYKELATDVTTDHEQALKKICTEIALVDLSNNDISTDSFANIFCTFPFPQILELYLVLFFCYYT